MKRRGLVLQMSGSPKSEGLKDLKVHFLFEGVVAELRVPRIVRRSSAKAELRAAAEIVLRVGSVLKGD